MRIFGVCLLLLFAGIVKAQQGIVTGTVLDERNKALESITVQLIPFSDSTATTSTTTDKNGFFSLNQLLFGYYKLRLSYVSLQPLTLDSLYLRADRFDFNLGDIVLKAKTTNNLDEIIIYAEKPLIQSKEGNITFNAGESALSQGSSASDLLTQVPLISKDPDGKMLVRGKEPKILIDDKPVDLNMQQLQDLLESLPGSSIEKIEVMTNPPPQYANEQGGVINIVTRKGTVGKSGRISVSAGTRGEVTTNASFLYRKNNLSLNINAGITNNQFAGTGYSIRQNIYTDSSNFFNTNNNYANHNVRPNLRANVDYEISKEHLLNLVLLYNQNSFSNNNGTTYRNIDQFNKLYRLSERSLASNGDSYSPNISFTYTYKSKTPGETFKLFTNYNNSDNTNNKNFYQQFFNPDYTFTGNDSTQVQSNNNVAKGYNIRLAYDKPLNNAKTYLSLGSFYTKNISDINIETQFKNKDNGLLLPIDLQSNYFIFYQGVANFRGSVKQQLANALSVTAGLSVERTNIYFDLQKAGTDTSNTYWTWLPFANLNKTWKNNLNLTLSYRRTIRRPGIGELNPTRDYSDPYNIRYGNPTLLPSPAHVFDAVLGYSKNALYTNIGVGFNKVDAIFSQIRTLLPEGITETIWQNISGRKEYEISSWSGYSFSRKLRLNYSATYSYNQYSDYDIKNRSYRNGGSLTSNLNTNYTFKEIYTASGNFTYNRFANPQGTVRSNVSMNIGLMAKLLNKKFTVSLNFIDPFFQQQNNTFTYGSNFVLENYSSTNTRNYRLTLGYNFSRSVKKATSKTIKAVQKITNQ